LRRDPGDLNSRSFLGNIAAQSCLIRVGVAGLQIDQDQFRTKPGKQLRRGAADSRSRTSDHHDLSGQAQHASS
jgi:hypothetical protein